MHEFLTSDGSDAVPITQSLVVCEALRVKPLCAHVVAIVLRYERQVVKGDGDAALVTQFPAEL